MEHPAKSFLYETDRGNSGSLERLLQSKNVGFTVEKSGVMFVTYRITAPTEFRAVIDAWRNDQASGEAW